MILIKLGSNDSQTIHFSLYDGDRNITGPFINNESFEHVESLVVLYQSFLYNLQNKHFFIAQITYKDHLGQEKKYPCLILASNEGDLAWWVEGRKKEGKKVEIKRIMGFKTEDIELKLPSGYTP